MLRCLLILFVTVTVACKSKQQHIAKSQQVATVDSAPIPNMAYYDSIAKLPFGVRYIDSQHVGRPGKNKILVETMSRNDSIYISIQLYSLKDQSWKLRQSSTSLIDFSINISPILRDLNGDGYRDLAYESNKAARGGNIIQRWFIYSAKGDSLIFIRNSDAQPNLAYSRYQKCIYSFALFGGSSTSFLKLVNDSLTEIATVSIDNGWREVRMGSGDMEKILYRDSVGNDDAFASYKYYNPPRSFGPKDKDGTEDEIKLEPITEE